MLYHIIYVSSICTLHIMCISSISIATVLCLHSKSSVVMVNKFFLFKNAENLSKASKQIERVNASLTPCTKAAAPSLQAL